VLATHGGIEAFTVGQRKGLGFAAGGRRYVLKIVPGDNSVVVGERDELLSSGLTSSGVNWLTDEPAGPVPCLAKVRYRHTPAAATVTPLPGGRARSAFAEPVSAVTPGQAVVFYDGTRVLGGGWIEGPETISER
jgi:tRNA-specific 2-thiouridylase